MIVINGKEIKINRRNAFVSEMDEAYCALCRKILTFGLITPNRTGIDTKSIAGWSYTFDLENGYPIAETKKVVASNFAKEIQWIHQVQSNDVRWLHERDNHIWDSWVVDSDGIWREYEQGENAIDDPDRAVVLMRQISDHKDNGNVRRIRKLDEFRKEILVRPTEEVQKYFLEKKGKLPTIKRATFFGIKFSFTIGEQYGYVNGKYRQSQNIEWTLKNDPNNRRMQINLWQLAHFAKAVLPSCVYCCEFKVTPDGRLHAYVHQRSADVPAGLPFNISQYALLLSMFAKANGFKPGTLSWSIMDAHIYVDQIPAIKKQLKRYDYMKEYEKLIQTSTDETVEREYNYADKRFNLNDIKAYHIIRTIPVETIAKMVKKFEPDGNELSPDAFNEISMVNRYKLLEYAIEKENMEAEKEFIKEYEESFERKECFEHMLTRETPYLELEEHNSIFDYSTDYVKKGDSYLEENPIGNKELVLKNYHPTSFISVPVAQ